MTSSASQPYSVDWRYIKKVWREITASEYLKEKIDAIPEVVDNVHDRSTDKALSANQWRLLQDQIDELKTPWKFLGNWNSATWLSEISLSTNPYVYSNWDYFVVANVSNTTNYKPNWIMYTDWVASDVEETDAVGIDDRYMFNWNDWILIPASQRQIAIDQALSSTSTNPVENRVIKAKLDSMDADIENKANASSGATWEQPAWNPGDIYVDEDEDKIYIKWVDSWKDISEWWGGWKVYTEWKCIEITDQNVINVDWDRDVEYISDTEITISLNQYKIDNYQLTWLPYCKYLYREWATSYKIPVWDIKQLELTTWSARWTYISYLRTCNPANWEAVDYVTWLWTSLYPASWTVRLWIPDWTNYILISWKWNVSLSDYSPASVKIINSETETLNLVERVSSIENEKDDCKWYKWKIISIMWDSISTFDWYIPHNDWYNLEHAIYYPRWEFTDVNKTWWLKLIKNLWAKLWVNESWSWSRISNTATSDWTTTWPNVCMASITRITNLWANWTPDIILFYWGTNDIASTIGLWTFDSTANYNITDLTNSTWSTFSEAFKVAIMRMQYFYPMSKLIVLLPAYCKDDKYTMGKLDTWNDRMKEICDYFWVQYFDLRTCWITRQNMSTTLLDGRVHPNYVWADLIEKFVRNKLLSTYELDPWENITYPIWFNLNDWLTIDKPYLRAVSAWTPLTIKFNSSDWLRVDVSMWWIDISSSYDQDTKTITINSVSWEIVISASVSSEEYSYVVNHYKQNLDWSTYPWTPDSTETVTVSSWSVVTPSVETYTWFTSPSAQTITVNQPWLSVNYYYTRNSYTLSFNTNWWTEVPSQSVYYWADILSLLPTVTKSWYYLPYDILQAWDYLPSDLKMPANNLELSAFWCPDWTTPETTWYEVPIQTSNWKITWTWIKVLNTALRAIYNYYDSLTWNKIINTIRFAWKNSSWTIQMTWVNNIWDPMNKLVLSKSFTSADKTWNIITVEFNKHIECVIPCIFPTIAAASNEVTYYNSGDAPVWSWWYWYNIFTSPACTWCGEDGKWFIFMQFWYVDYRSWQNQEPDS